MEQIVYQETLQTFIDQCLVSKNIASKVREGMFNAGYSFVMPNWETSWNNSLPEIAKVLKVSNVDKDVDVAVEYRLKNSLERLDFLIYGLGSNNKKNMVIVELKQWSQVEVTSSMNKVHTMVAKGHFEDHFHPSYQALNYAGQLKAFNEYVQNEKMGIESCSYCHYMDNGFETIMDDIKLFPFVDSSPSFLENDGEKLRTFIEKYVSKKCHNILYEINKARTIPSDDFASLVKEALKGNQMYTLDFSQQTALSTIVDTVRECIYYDQKKTIIVKGGAGTGKSIIAINALGQLISPKKKENRITTMFATVNAAPKKVLYNGLIKGKEYKASELESLFKYPTVFANRPRNEIPCLLIDEAHRIFKMKGGVGLKSGTNMLKELINAAKVSVFFIDDNQAVTKDDYATIEIIKDLAKECRSQLIMGPELELTSQYRVQGGAEYIEFIKSFLGIRNGISTYNSCNSYEFKVFDNPNEMFDAIKTKDTESRIKQSLEEGKTSYASFNGRCRVVAGYTYEWKSNPSIRDGVNDVIIEKDHFAKKWNLRYGSGLRAYSWADDPDSIDEIGCIHTCQGVDLDYCGVIIGKDITYENGEIVFHKEAHPKSDLAGIRNASDADAKTWIENTYYVLLTRGIRGTYVYCEDDALREYLKSKIKYN
ncbi:MAG TPA: hypothetical protein DCR94_05495 [Firmicutes bacterium]|nr:hypothetical protein [Bacillota bacterium]